MKKTCLITGMNKAQCTRKFYLKQQLKIVPQHYGLYNCLVDMGYDVEQRVVNIGEDLSKYDEVIVFIAGPRQLVATTVFEGLWAVANRPDCILSVDDWQLADLFKGVAKCTDEKELFAEFILGVNKKTLEELLPYKQDFIKATKQIASKTNRMLACAYNTKHLDSSEHGPHLLFEKIGYPEDRLFTFNPNPYHRNRTWDNPGHEGPEDPSWIAPSLAFEAPPFPEKERRFNFASLVQSKTQKWLKKQGYTGNPKDDEQGDIAGWNVDLYGSKADTQKRLTEDEMLKVIARDWACLMPGYEHAGSGWWRVRPQNCADVGSILIGDKKELEVYYGLDYPFYDLKASDLATLTDDELVEIASTQRECLYRLHPLDKAVQQSELTSILTAKK